MLLNSTYQKNLTSSENLQTPSKTKKNYINSNGSSKNNVKGKKKKASKNINKNKSIDEDNPYNDDSNNQEPQFNEKTSEIMPLESGSKIHYEDNSYENNRDDLNNSNKNNKDLLDNFMEDINNNSKNNKNINKDNTNKPKNTKLKLLKLLKIYKKKIGNRKNIAPNVAAKIRIEDEQHHNSLKYILSQEAQFDIKKEISKFKPYFRFWKKKTKISKELNYNKKDRNIRITTIIYRAEASGEIKNTEMEMIQKEKFRQNLIKLIQKRPKPKIKYNPLNYDINKNNNINHYYNKNYSYQYKNKKTKLPEKKVEKNEYKTNYKYKNNKIDINGKNGKVLKNINKKDKRYIGFEKLNNFINKKKNKKF